MPLRGQYYSACLSEITESGGYEIAGVVRYAHARQGVGATLKILRPIVGIPFFCG